MFGGYETAKAGDWGGNHGIMSRSLFYWMFGGYKPHFAVEVSQSRSVSILVLLDVWWVRRSIGCIVPITIMSRSLFYWMFGGYVDKGAERELLRQGVSILVLLDVWWVRYQDKLCLQPTGSVSRSLFYWMFGGYPT